MEREIEHLVFEPGLEMSDKLKELRDLAVMGRAFGFA